MSILTKEEVVYQGKLVELEFNQFKGKSLKVFVSYQSNDKRLAGSIKNELELYGMTVFLAHEDIEPCTTDVEVILRELRQCDVFMPLLTNSYRNSPWTDQELGAALAYGAFIIALKVNKAPHGFIERRQALSFKYEEKDGVIDCVNSCKEIFRLIHKQPSLEGKAADALVSSLSQSRCFEDTKPKISLLKEISSFTKEQVNELVRAGIINRNVYESYRAKPFLEELNKKHNSWIDALHGKVLLGTMNGK